MRTVTDLNFQEKELYHEIHPLKLLTDLSAGLVALYVLWQRQLVLGLLVMFIPSILASVLIIRAANLEKLRDSSAGRYVERYMSNSVRIVRLGGNVVMMIGAWYHLAYLIPIGLIVIVLAWSGGLMARSPTRNTKETEKSEPSGPTQATKSGRSRQNSSFFINCDGTT